MRLLSTPMERLRLHVSEIGNVYQVLTITSSLPSLLNISLFYWYVGMGELLPVLDTGAFERILGNLKDVMKKRVGVYEKQLIKLARQTL